jgi:CspA family cold shock protein
MSPFGQLPFPTSELPGRACGPFDRHLHAFTGKDTQMRTTGTVKFFNTAEGFGFIQPENGGKDVFVHATALEAAGIFSLNEGDKASFVLEDDRKGRGKQAGQVQKA